MLATRTRKPGPIGRDEKDEHLLPVGQCSPSHSEPRRAIQGMDIRKHTVLNRWDAVEENQGFDSGSLFVAAHQVLQPGARCKLRLRKGHRLAAVAENPNVVAVAQIGDDVTLTACSEGETTIHAVNKRNASWSPLRVHVRPALKLKIAFYYIRDSANRESKRTRDVALKPSEQSLFRAHLVDEVNRILPAQTCIQFEQYSGHLKSDKMVHDLKVDFGALINSKDLNTKKAMIDLTSENNTFQMINVFFVWDMPTAGGDKVGGEMLQNGNCLFGDAITEHAGRILAHEIGHFLTGDDLIELYGDLHGHSKTDNTRLMSEMATGERITWQEATAMYSTALNRGAQRI